MTIRIDDGTSDIFTVPGYGVVYRAGPTSKMPADGGVGFAHGCIFQVLDSSGPDTGLYTNVGDKTSCDFDPVEVSGGSSLFNQLTLTGTGVSVGSPILSLPAFTVRERAPGAGSVNATEVQFATGHTGNPPWTWGAYTAEVDGHSISVWGFDTSASTSSIVAHVNGQHTNRKQIFKLENNYFTGSVRQDEITYETQMVDGTYRRNLFHYFQAVAGTSVWIFEGSTFQLVPEGTLNITDIIVGPKLTPTTIVLPKDGLFKALNQASSEVAILKLNTSDRLQVGADVEMASYHMALDSGLTNASTRPVAATTAGSAQLFGYGLQDRTSDFGFLRLRAGGGTSANFSSFIDIVGFSNDSDMNGSITLFTYGGPRFRATYDGKCQFVYGNTLTSTIGSTVQMQSNGGVFFWPSADSTAAFKWLKADQGTVLMQIDSTNGRIGIGAAPSQDAVFQINASGLTANDAAGIYNTVGITANANATYGAKDVVTQGTNGTAGGTIIGRALTLQATASHKPVLMVGFGASLNNYTGSGTVNMAKGFNSNPFCANSAVFTEFRHYSADDVVTASSGTVGTQYGYYAAAMTTATTNWAFYADGATPSRFGGSITLASGANLVIDGATSGTKIGTATSQKIGVWNAAPIIQPTTGVAAATFVANTSLIANDTATFDGYTIGQVVKALRNIGLLA